MVSHGNTLSTWRDSVLTFKIANGFGWLTSHRLILCEHPPGQLDGHAPEEYWLKNIEKATIKDSTLTAKFHCKRTKMLLPLYAPSLLEDIKAYIEKAAENWKKPK